MLERVERRMQENSARPCGCDPGCGDGHVCDWHKMDAQFGVLLGEIERGEEPPLPVGMGIGGAPTRATTLPTDPKLRKQYPIASGVLDYFPDAIVAISHLSYRGNEQHNPGKPLHWDRSKSADESDTMLRHFLERGTIDTDGVRHTAKLCWRALAILQKEIEAAKP